MPTELTRDHLKDPVTAHMRREFTRLRPNQTVAGALDDVRRHPTEGRIIYFYVVDDEGRLQGVVPTRRLLLSPLDRRISDLMAPQVIALPASASVLDACEFFTMHRLLAFPVIDEERRVVGVVDVELYTRELSTIETNEANDHLFQLIGVHLTEAQQASPLASFRGRFPWLLCNIGGGIAAAFLSGLYEDELQRVVHLALFIPVVLALAESVSIQSVSLALQALHGRPSARELLRKLRFELSTGVLLSAASGLLVGLVALGWLGHARVALCLLGGIAAGVTAAAGLGLAMPNLIRLLRRDPHLAAGPIALAASDMITLLVYFNLARWLLG